MILDIYMILLSVVILSAVVLRGTRKKNTIYVIFVTVLLFSVLALRGIRVGADLGRYETHYEMCYSLAWSELFKKYPNNILFYVLMKLQSEIFGYDFHGLIFLLAVFEGIIVGKMILKYSVNPYMSFLIYISMGYYAFNFSGLKQSLAMSLIMLAYDACISNKLGKFIVTVFLASIIHLPSIIFLPAYYLGHRRLNVNMILFYILFAGTISMARGNLVEYMTDIYGAVVSNSVLGGVGGKVVMMLVFIVGGFFLRIPDGENHEYSATFHFMILATILQTFATYGNVFERLADYYFIFSIFYIPFIFENTKFRKGSTRTLINYNNQIYVFLNLVILIFSIIYFDMTIHETYGMYPYYLN